MVIDMPGAVNPVVPDALEICRHGTLTGRRYEKISAELEIKLFKTEILFPGPVPGQPARSVKGLCSMR